MFKSIASFFKTKVNAAIENALTPEDVYRDASRQLIGEIDRLRHASITTKREIVTVESNIQKHLRLQKQKEKEIIAISRSGADVSKSHVVLALQHKNIVEGLTAKREEMIGVNVQIAESVVELSAKLEDVKLNLDIIRLNSETSKLGLSVAEDVVAAAAHVSVNVDTLVTKVDVLLGGGAGDMTKVTSFDVDEYLKTLKAQA
ncbi:hypothetical protein POP12_123 [Pectobacterium phage POP12]|nr:hypothetical protein POP12_123 [Pectobacterium phage POP12]